MFRLDQTLDLARDHTAVRFLPPRRAWLYAIVVLVAATAVFAPRFEVPKGKKARRTPASATPAGPAVGQGH